MGVQLSCVLLLAWASVAGAQVPVQRVLLNTADLHHLSIVACDVGDSVCPGDTFSEDLQVTLANLRRSGVDAAVWRGILIARPGNETPLREVIGAAVDGRSCALLLRPVGQGEEWEPGWQELVVECARRMVKHDTSDEAYRIAAEAATWMAAESLTTWLRWDEACRSGQVLLHVEPGVEGQKAAMGWSGSTLLAQAPPTAPDTVDEPLRARLADASYNPIRDYIESKQGTISVAEGERRHAAQGIEACRVGIGEANARFDLDWSGALSEVGALLSDGTEIGLEVEQPGEARLWLRLTGAAAEDSVIAISAACRRFPLAGPHGVTLAAPQVAREAIYCVVPLEDWQAVASSSNERFLNRRATEQRLWALLSGELLRSLTSGWVWLDEIPEPMRSEVAAACRASSWDAAAGSVWSLPPRDGPIPLWLTEVSDSLAPYYELRSPGCLEDLRADAFDAIRAAAGAAPSVWNVGDQK